MTAAKSFFDARDLLLRHRTDYDRAYREFTWPQLGDFNWALDYFDVIARENHNPALWIVDDPAGDGLRLSYAQMSERSARMANFLRASGVGRGDHVLLMLPNRVELWDVMLAAMKLGAIVLPATTQLSPDDVRGRRLRRVAAIHPRWHHARHRHAAAVLHVGHDIEAQARRAHASELSGRPSVHDVLDRAATERHPLEHQLTGLGQARVELLLRAVERAGLCVRVQLRAVRAERHAERAGAFQRHHAVRAADRVAHARAGAARGLSGQAA
jgi:hypothetical protein